MGGPVRTSPGHIGEDPTSGVSFVKEAADYLAYIKALIVVNPQVLRFNVVREEAQGDRGLLRYRLTLRGSLLEIFELFQIVEGMVQVTKYSFHWQDKTGKLLKRWDNAAHHRELSTSPHHVHDGKEENVRPHESVSAEEVLTLVTAEALE
jgi:hypothetical protein